MCSSDLAVETQTQEPQTGKVQLAEEEQPSDVEEQAGEEQVVPIIPEKVNHQPSKKLENVYTTMTTEEDELYKTIKVIVKIPKKYNVDLIDKTSEPSLSFLQKIV